MVFSNREPYIHVHTEQGVEVERPASGLVSAMEPVLRNRGGLWIAHGSGSADAEHCDNDGILPVPPENPRYQLKRVWLSPSERRSYYDGFSNEALWPLFHLAHHEPIFRKIDWESYNRVNERFSDSLSDDLLQKNSSILVQDFHLSLVPKLLRLRLGRLQGAAKIALTWHIPWVPADVFRICPWSVDLLEGILGADLITFHTSSYCTSFLECCERLLECRVDREKPSVTYRGIETRVQAVPIGIDPPPISSQPIHEIKSRVTELFGVSPEVLGLGVDRLDYTKGIPQRLQAIERFFEQNPEFIDKMTFLQVASPSRVDVPAYQRFSLTVQMEVERINARFKNGDKNPPIKLISKHLDWETLTWLYRVADFCLVSSLHDGMNLVAKEYVWSRQETTGALLLSRFTGASHELREAFQFNPYDTDEAARTIRTALSAPQQELSERMSKLRERVLSRTAQSWADEIIKLLAS